MMTFKLDSQMLAKNVLMVAASCPGLFEQHCRIHRHRLEGRIPLLLDLCGILCRIRIDHYEKLV